MIAAQSLVSLSTESIAADIDLNRGAEVLTLADRRTGINVLLTTPWADEARARRPVGLDEDPTKSEEQWTSTYAGGWQTLFPHAGTPVEVDGELRHYHGESSSVPWKATGGTGDEVSAHLDLTTVPLTIERTIRLRASTLTVHDTIINDSARAIAYDYQSHPAFGAPFLEGGCTVDLDASTYTPDPRFEIGEFPPGEPVLWPLAPGRQGIVDLSAVPASASRVFRFGWLEGLGARRVTVTNPRLGLAAVLEWPDDARNLAWVWLDTGAQMNPPWYGVGYALAIEPSTRTTAHPGRVPAIEPDSRREFTTSITLRHIPDNHSEQRSS